MMLSKTQSKYIRSLALQKFRKEHGTFLAEGEKIVEECFLSDLQIELVAATEDWIKTNQQLLQKQHNFTIGTVDELGLKQVSCLQSPNKVVAVVKQKKQLPIEHINNWCIALDGIRDPGNMGTILRIADWFGIQHVVASEDCVDFYNPKVVQAAMGAHLRINMYQHNLLSFIQNSQLPAFAATLHGENIYQSPQCDKGILIIGNESQGIQQELINVAKYKITIPKKGGAESLNAGVSAGILCAILLR